MLFLFCARARCVFLAAAILTAFAPVAFGAQTSAALRGVPLADDYGGGASPHSVQNTPAQPAPIQGVPVSPEGRTSLENPLSISSDVPQGVRTEQGKDAAVLAYLIELARKQRKPCPSGAMPPEPPALTFSEPLCRAAEALNHGTDALAAFAANGVPVAKWRTFRASAEYPAQSVATALRQAHCEALHEPFTHIGVSRDAKGWSVIMAELAGKPDVDAVPAPSGATNAPPTQTSQPAAEGEGAIAPAVSGSVAAASAVVPLPSTGPSSSASAASDVPPGMPVRITGAEETPARLAVMPPVEPDKAAGFTGQESRALFMLLNEVRAKGGMCYGNAMPPAPPLLFHAELQAAAESGAAESLAKDGTMLAPLSLPLYPGTNVTKFHAVTKAQPSAVLDVWMLNPANCQAIRSADFSDAGVGFAQGHWVVLLGGKGKGVDSPEPPGLAAREGLEPSASSLGSAGR